MIIFGWVKMIPYTMDTFAELLAVPSTGPAGGLSPLSKCALPGPHNKKATPETFSCLGMALYFF